METTNHHSHSHPQGDASSYEFLGQLLGVSPETLLILQKDMEGNTEKWAYLSCLLVSAMSFVGVIFIGFLRVHILQGIYILIYFPLHILGGYFHP